jgi:hypothetical protein
MTSDSHHRRGADHIAQTVSRPGLPPRFRHPRSDSGFLEAATGALSITRQLTRWPQVRVDRSGHDSCPRPPELMTNAATRCAASTGVVRV